MSGPPAWTVHEVPLAVWPPTGVTAPMSAQLQPVGQTRVGGGNSPAVTATVSRVTAEPVPWACEVMARPANSGWGRFSSRVEPGTRVQVTPSGDV